VLISVADRDKEEILPAIRKLHGLGFQLLATRGTRAFLSRHQIPSEETLKLHEGRPSVTDDILNKQVKLIINTPAGEESAHDDSYIRKLAIREKIPYITTVAAALASVEGIAAVKQSQDDVRSLQQYQSGR